MASPPFNLDTSNPADNAPENTYPANERPFRDNVQSYLGVEHDILSGHHAFPHITTTARDAIVNWPSGALIYNTTLAVFQMNTGTTVSPVWSVNALPTQVTYHSSLITSTGTFTFPVADVNFILIGGGGGGGGGSYDATHPGGGAGGGSGAYIFYPITGATVGNTVAVTVGTMGIGGILGTPGTAGSAGGNTILASGTQTITTATAGGGGGGPAGSISVLPTAKGAAGVASGGIVGTTINLDGDTGSIGFSVASTIGIPGVYGVVGGGIGTYGFGGAGGWAGTPVAGAQGDNGLIGCCLAYWYILA